jgi:hypothetical protein
VVAASDGDAREAVDALAAAGVRVAAILGFAEAAHRLETPATADLILVEAAGIAPALSDPVLTAAGSGDAAVIVMVDIEAIDAAAALLFGARAQLLCRPTPADRLCAVVLAKPRVSARLHDASRDSASERLQRLNEEVARIAEALARLAHGDVPAPTALREPEALYRGPEADEQPVTPSEIRATIRARRMRSQFFTGDLFADPAWDMLLDLFAAALERRMVSVSSLCIAAAVPPTTALRWIGALHDAGLFEREADPADRRRAYVMLSPRGLDGMRAYATAVKRAGLPLV